MRGSPALDGRVEEALGRKGELDHEPVAGGAEGRGGRGFVRRDSRASGGREGASSSCNGVSSSKQEGRARMLMGQVSGQSVQQRRVLEVTRELPER